MDQLKIGKFIRKKRKENNITQSELAEKLNITDRAISKWENGNCMPDSGIIPELCNILNITINDLFSGEIVDMKDNEKELEKNLLEMIKLKEQSDKRLLSLEILIGALVSIVFLVCVFVVSYISMKDAYRIIIIVVGVITFIVGITYCLKIEQCAGYYECNNCHYKYIPTFSSILWAMHINRTRYLKCPKCRKRSWSRKVLSRNNNID